MGMYYRVLEYEKDLHSWLYELEQDRINNNLLNHGIYDEINSSIINKLGGGLYE